MLSLLFLLAAVASAVNIALGGGMLWIGLTLVWIALAAAYRT